MSGCAKGQEHECSDDQETDDQARQEAVEALARLRAWALEATPTEIAELDPAIARLLPDQPLANVPELSRDYPEDFEVDAQYRASLPDLQNGPSSLIKGEKQHIEHVGISNFRLPIRFHTRDNGDITLEPALPGRLVLRPRRRASTCPGSCGRFISTRKNL